MRAYYSMPVIDSITMLSKYSIVPLLLAKGLDIFKTYFSNCHNRNQDLGVEDYVIYWRHPYAAFTRRRWLYTSARRAHVVRL